MTRAARIVADPNPVMASHHDALAVTTLRWEATGAEAVEVRVGAPDGPLLSRSGPVGSATTGEWVTNGMTFLLQDASPGLPLTAEHTLATTQVSVTTEAARGLILMYHRVAEVGRDPWSMAVTPSHFAEHLAVIRALARPRTLRYFAQALRDGDEVEPWSVAFTFDDGYADNLHQAKPCLERHDVPATVFVTAAYIGGQRDFWWDALDCLLRAPRLPPTLCLTIGGREHRWALPEAGQAMPGEWRASRETASGPRAKVYWELHELLKSLPERERLPVIDDLLGWACVERVSRAEHRQLSMAELRELAGDDLVEVGSHGLTHSDLPSLAVEAQQHELARSRMALTEMLGRPVTSFAYPYGSLRPDTPALVEAAGYECACLASGGGIRRGSERFRIPRVKVEDWDGDGFARRLRHWLA